MSGKEFEDLVARWARGLGDKGSISRYGVQAVRAGPTQIIAMKSLPDFEGILSDDHRQIIFDCKVCSQASFNLSPYRDRKKRQTDHMLERSQYGAICGFLIHWNERRLKTKSEVAETWWFPIHHEMKFWHEFKSAEVRRITRADCREYGTEVTWQRNKPDLCSTLTILTEATK